MTSGDMERVWLIDWLAVQNQLLIFEMKAIAWNADGTLHERLVQVERISEYDDVAALYIAVWEQVARRIVRGGVDEFIH